MIRFRSSPAAAGPEYRRCGASVSTKAAQVHVDLAVMNGDLFANSATIGLATGIWRSAPSVAPLDLCPDVTPLVRGWDRLRDLLSQLNSGPARTSAAQPVLPRPPFVPPKWQGTCLPKMLASLSEQKIHPSSLFRAVFQGPCWQIPACLDLFRPLPFFPPSLRSTGRP